MLNILRSISAGKDSRVGPPSAGVRAVDIFGLYGTFNSDDPRRASEDGSFSPYDHRSLRARLILENERYERAVGEDMKRFMLQVSNQDSSSASKSCQYQSLYCVVGR